MPAGVYVYVGSAMGRRGPATLARRLLRHAVRSGRRKVHRVFRAPSGKGAEAPTTNQPILGDMLRTFVETGLAPPGVRPPARKSLHWHVDYLLEHPAAVLTQAIAIRSAGRLEDSLAAHLAADPGTVPLAPGLGASDAAGQTHLLRAPAALSWWEALAREARLLITGGTPFT